MTPTLLLRKWNGRQHSQIAFGDLPSTIRHEIKLGQTFVINITEEEVERDPRGIAVARLNPPVGHISNAIPRATLDENCTHTNLNWNGSRCLSCGVWMKP